jgi:CHASE2 domain-containing sensor protein
MRVEALIWSLGERLLGDGLTRTRAAYDAATAPAATANADVAADDDSGPCVEPATDRVMRKSWRRSLYVVLIALVVAHFDLFGVRTATDRASEHAAKVVLSAAFGVGGGGLPEGVPDVAVILIDEPSILADPLVAEWPLPCSRLADLVIALNAFEHPPRAVFFDIYWRGECGGRGSADRFVDAIRNPKPNLVSIDSLLSNHETTAPTTRSETDAARLPAPESAASGQDDPKFPVYVGGVLPVDRARRGADVVGDGEATGPDCETVASSSSGFAQSLDRPVTLKETVVPKIANSTCVVPIAWRPSFPDGYPLLVDAETGRQPDAPSAGAAMPAAAIFWDLGVGRQSSYAGIDPGRCLGPDAGESRFADEAHVPSEMSVVWRLDTSRKHEALLFGPGTCAFVDPTLWDKVSFGITTFLDALIQGVLGQAVEHGGWREAVAAFFGDVAESAKGNSAGLNPGDDDITVCPPNGVVPYSWVLGQDAELRDAAREYLSDKVVMVGASALLTGDEVYAPGHGLLPGVFFHAMAYRNLAKYPETYLRHRAHLPVVGAVDASSLLELLLVGVLMVIAIPVTVASAMRGQLSGSERRCGLDAEDLDRDLQRIQACAISWCLLISNGMCVVAFFALSLSPANWIGLIGVSILLIPGGVLALFRVIGRRAERLGMRAFDALCRF